MKAYVLDGIGQLNIKDVEMPCIANDEVIISVKAAGICGSDIPRVYKTGTYHFPTIPGHEFSGIVEKAGDGASEWLGKRVGVFPLIPCMECPQCRKMQYEMCSNYNYLGSRTDGGFAEYVKAPKWNLIELPKNVTFEQAAMLEPMAVSVHAARQAGLISNSLSVGLCNSNDLCQNDTLNKKASICIIGLGTIGLSLLMMLISEGYENVYVVGNKDMQRDTAINIGLSESHYIDVDNFIIGEHIFDVCFDCVGTNTVVNIVINSVAPKGKVVLVGNPASDMNIDKKTYWQILRKQITIFGTWNSSFTHNESDDWYFVLDKLASGAICPEKLISHRFPFDKLYTGMEIMRDKSEEYVKVMMLNE